MTPDILFQVLSGVLQQRPDIGNQLIAMLSGPGPYADLPPDLPPGTIIQSPPVGGTMSPSGMQFPETQWDAILRRVPGKPSVPIDRSDSRQRIRNMKMTPEEARQRMSPRNESI
jgi:hypothetical protein